MTAPLDRRTSEISPTVASFESSESLRVFWHAPRRNDERESQRPSLHAPPAPAPLPGDPPAALRGEVQGAGPRALPGRGREGGGVGEDAGRLAPARDGGRGDD